MNYGRREIALMVTLLAGCLPELERYEGEHIVFEHSASLEVCAGTVDYLDRTIPFLSEQLGVPTPARIRYSWLTPEDRERLLGSLGTQEAGGLAVGYRASSFFEPVLEHEIVHAIMGLNVTARYFQEGLATVYEELVRGRDEFSAARAQPDPRPMMTAATDRDVDYERAGRFVYFLIARHGIARFVEFYSRLDGPYTLTQIRAVFGRVYGIELDDEVELYMSGMRSCDEDYFEILAARCVGPVLPWRGDVWTFAGVLACDDPGVIGGSTNRREVPEFRVATLEIESAGIYDFTAFAEGDLSLQLSACFGCPWANVKEDVPEGNWRWKLAAGRYHVRVEGDADLGARFSVVVRPVGSGVPPTGD